MSARGTAMTVAKVVGRASHDKEEIPPLRMVLEHSQFFEFVTVIPTGETVPFMVWRRSLKDALFSVPR